MRITPEEFRKKFQKEKLLLIDIRPHAIFLKGSIQGAKNIPYSILRKIPSKYLEHSKTYYIFCEEGYYTNKLIEELKDQNYHLIEIEGGYQAL